MFASFDAAVPVIGLDSTAQSCHEDDTSYEATDVIHIKMFGPFTKKLRNKTSLMLTQSMLFYSSTVHSDICRVHSLSNALSFTRWFKYDRD